MVPQLPRVFLLAIALFLAVLPASLSAQSISDLDSIDFTTLSVDDLSDSQIQEVLRRSEEQGLSMEQLEQMALARGLPSSELIKLRQRMQRLRGSSTEEQDEESASLWERRGFDDETDPLDILLYSRDLYRAESDSTESFPGDMDSDRPIFGRDLFRAEELSFEPSLNIPAPIGYRLAAGDELVVDVWGAAEQRYQQTITRDGTLQIENIGPISVSGLTIEEAKRRIINRLTQIYAGLNSGGGTSSVYADVSLGRARSIKIHVLGEVERPGTYTLPGLATLLNALYVSGGPSDVGTFRAVQLVRASGESVWFDVYDLIIKGDQTGNVQLRDQDIVKIDPHMSRVLIDGEVKRPAYYEMKPDETLRNLLQFAGSFTGSAFRKRLKIYRNGPSERQIISVPEERYDLLALQDGDEVQVDTVLARFENRVEIQGAVNREGDYQLEEAGTVFGLIQLAEGLTGEALLERAQVFRTRPDKTQELIPIDLSRLLSSPAEVDIPLEKNDVIVVPSRFDLREELSVQVYGSVQEPGQYEYRERMTLNDALVVAGGFLDEASFRRIEVARRRTSAAEVPGQIADVFYFDVDGSFGLDAQDQRFELLPFDQIFVRKSPSYIPQRFVQIAGEVDYPGVYAISNKDDRVSSMIARAGGLTESAFARGATLIRNSNDVGPVGIELDRILRAPGSEVDLLVEDQDSIHVPVRLETVKIEGSVYFPVSVRFTTQSDFLDYVSQAGGPTDFADLKKSYVVYANGSVDRVRRSFLAMRYPDIQPGARLVIPPKPDREGMSAQERTLILSSIISIAAIVSTTVVQLSR